MVCNGIFFVKERSCDYVYDECRRERDSGWLSFYYDDENRRDYKDSYYINL